MSKNTRWSQKDFKDKGLVQNADGVFVNIKTLTPKGKVEKLPLMDIGANQRLLTPAEYERELMQTPIPVVGREFDGSDFAIYSVDEAGLMESLPLKSDPAKIKFKFAHPKEELQFVTTVNFYGETFFQLETGEQIIPKHVFDLEPHPAPRMSRSDQWKVDPHHPDPDKRQRPIVTSYFAFRDAFRALCAEKGYTLTETIRVLFIVRMPPSWSKKKRAGHAGKKHQLRPDTDNMIKAIKDSFRADDGFVWDERGIKIWGEKGQIIIF